MPTPTVSPTRASQTPGRAVPARPSLPVKKTAAPLAPHMSGPRLFQVMRVGLVVWTLVSTVLCLASVLASQSHQETSAGALVHAQDLRDLRSEVTHAQSAALISLIDPQTTGADSWKTYDDSRTQVDLLLLGAAASAVHPADLQDVATALGDWQDTCAVAHHDALGAGMAPDATTQITSSYADVLEAITWQLNATSNQESSSTPFIVLSIVASVLGGLGFVVVSVVTARRSHRVINIGLSVGLLAIIAAIVTVGVYANQSGKISVTDSRIASLSTAESDVWTSLSEDALSILEPDSSQTHTVSATNSVSSASTAVNSANPVYSSVSTSVSALTKSQSTISSTSDPDARKALIQDQSVWQDAANAISAAIDAERPASMSLVVPALGYVITVATCCVIAIIATLAGIHARTKEYA